MYWLVSHTRGIRLCDTFKSIGRGDLRLPHALSSLTQGLSNRQQTGQTTEIGLRDGIPIKVALRSYHKINKLFS